MLVGTWGGKGETFNRGAFTNRLLTLGSLGNWGQPWAGLFEPKSQGMSAKPDYFPKRGAGWSERGWSVKNLEGSMRWDLF